MSEYQSAWVRHDDPEYDGLPKPRKSERAGKPRAARETDLAARLYAIGRAAVDDWQEGR